MNINKQRYIESIEERLNIGINLYGNESSFMDDYSYILITKHFSNEDPFLCKNDIDNFFKKWKIFTREDKLKIITNKLK